MIYQRVLCAGKELMEAGKSGDVFRLLSIHKDPDTLALEAEKRVVLERAVRRFSPETHAQLGRW